MSEKMHIIDANEALVDSREVARLIRLNDMEAIPRLQLWTAQQEAIADALGDEGRINLEIYRARLYFDAGIMDDARAAFGDAITLADNYGKADRVAKIKEEMKGLGL